MEKPQRYFFGRRLQSLLKQSEHNVDNGLSRRNFLSLIAASVALAGLEGCKKPVQKIIPYVEAEIGTIPGIPKYYASTLPFKNNALGVVIENHDERPVKVEGNEKHPATMGKSNSFAQASTLEMYDPDRARGIKFKGNNVEWSEYLKFAKSINKTNGKGLAVLMQESSSPTIKSIKEDFKKNLPNAIGLCMSQSIMKIFMMELKKLLKITATL